MKQSHNNKKNVKIDKRRDDTLRRMLNTPPKPHQPRGVDDSELIATEAELKQLLALFTPKTVDHISDLLDMFTEKTCDLFIVEGEDVPTLGATKGMVFLKPSPLFIELMAALRARAAELDILV